MRIANLKPFIALAALVAALVLAPAAVAQNSSAGVYAGQGGEVAADTVGGGPSDPTNTSTVSSQSSGTLPFTGLDVTLLVGGGLLLIGIGVGMSRLVARHSIS